MSGGKLSSDGNDILICNTSNVLVLHTALCSSMLKWNLPLYLIETAQEVDTLEQRDLTTDLTLKDCSNPGTVLQDMVILMTTLTTPDLSTGNVPDQPSLELTNLLHSAFGHIGSKRMKCDMCNAIRRWSLPWTPRKNETTGKMEISFMVNSLSLGDFTKESTVELEDKITAELLATTPNIVTPKSFKQAIASPKKSP
ncbi:hypothetical protein O181_007790 [Austropuccinia psidii MF-1]|uniref:Uncharacterized protein n=1 Tax=Austropuccinia psidii MF-1 TaxID=1389203 RepID=A0A9Q3BNQ1_9BASI|nr:hypothetical protein [Austropuccinia psidii MF-1]